MHLKALWRYPVKSLRGEPLTQAVLTEDGVEGDRRVHVSGARGPLTGRTRSRLLSVPSSTGADGEPLVAGHPWRSAAAARVVQEHAGPDARLRAHHGPERFDITNLLVVTQDEIDRLPGPALDLRRLRPNLVLGGAPDGAARSWDGAALAIGEAVVGVHSPRPRCIVTSIDPDTGQQDLDVFRRIRQHADNQIGLNCWVIQSGRVTVGDRIEVVATTARPDHVGGWIVGAAYRPASDSDVRRH